jgi:hypothetical protein
MNQGRPPKISINKIDLKGSPKPRAEINSDVVIEYAEHLRAGGKLPAVDLFTEDDTRYWVGDGWHRITAIIRASGEKADKLSDDVKIDAKIQRGGLRDCVFFAVGANAEHGLRRTSADKRRSVELLLHDGEWGKRSDSWIAEKCKVSDKTVAKIRAEIQPTSEIRSERKGKDGRTTNTARIGKKAKRPASAQPKLSREPDREPRQEMPEEPIEAPINTLSKGPEDEPARQDDPTPCPDSNGDVVDMPCQHLTRLFEMGFAYAAKGRFILRVRDEHRNGSERDLNYCPVCGVPVEQQAETSNQHERIGDVETAVSSPMSA